MPAFDYELTNNRGPLFTSTDNFYENFIPNLNRWNWSGDLPDSVLQASYANLKLFTLPDKLNCCAISDKIITIKQLHEMRRVIKAPMIILNDLSLDDDVDDDVALDISKETKNVIETLVIRKPTVSAKIFHYIEKYMPHVRYLYMFHVEGIVQENVTLPNLKTLSMVQTELKLLAKIKAPVLESLDVYKLMNVSPQESSSSSSHLSRMRLIENISILTQGTVKKLRIDTAILMHVPQEIFTDRYERLQFFGDAVLLDRKYIKLDLLLHAFQQASDIIIPPNLFTASSPIKLNILSKTCGIYHSDQHIETYLSDELLNLKIYDTSNPYKTAIIRNNTLYANFNIITDPTWSFLLTKNYFKDIKIRHEIIQQQPGKILGISDYVISTRPTRTLHFDKIKGNLSMTLSCTSAIKIRDSLFSILINLHEHNIIIKSVKLIILGMCKHEQYLRTNLFKPVANSIPTEVSNVLLNNLEFEFKPLDL